MVNKIIALLLLVILFPLLLLTGLIIYIVDGDPILYWSKRIGLNNRIFFMPKFRTMKINSPDIETHKLKNPEKYQSMVDSAYHLAVKEYTTRSILKKIMNKTPIKQSMGE